MPVQSASYKNMDRLFIDTNVLLDVLESRPTFVADSLRVIALAKSRQARAAVSPLSLSDITYILRESEQDRILRFFRELRVDRIWEGTSEIQRLIIARSLLKRGLDEM